MSGRTEMQLLEELTQIYRSANGNKFDFMRTVSTELTYSCISRTAAEIIYELIRVRESN